MATFAGVLSQFEKDKETEPTEGPGVLKSLLRGVAQSPADIASLVPNAFGGFPSGRLSRSPASISAASKESRTPDTEKFRERLAERSGIQEPVTRVERIAERVGRTAPFVAAGAPFAASSAGIIGVLTEIGADVLASAAGETSVEFGANAAGQFGVELLASIIVPGVAIRNAGEGAAKIAPEAVRRLAKKYKVSRSKVRKAASELKRRIARDPEGGEQFVDEAIDRLDEGLKKFPDKNKRPTSRQMLGEDSGQNISSMEEGLSRADLDFSASVEGRKRAVQADLEQEFDRLLPEGSSGGAADAFSVVRTRAKDAERAAWDAVPFDEMPSVSTRGLRKASDDLRNGPIAGRRFLPDELKVIDQYGDTISARELQALRSELLDTQRAGSLFNASDDARRKAQRVGSLLDVVEDLIEKLPRKNGDLYEKARRLTRENAELFNRKSAAVSVLSESADGRKIASRILSSGNGSEAKRAVRILEQEPGGVENLRRVFVDNLFDGELGNVTPRRMRSAIRRKRAVYREVFGEERLGELETLIEKAEIARVGKAGTASATASTGTGVSPVGMLFASADAFRHPVQAVGKGIGAVSRAMTRDVRTSPERNAILREALLDPKLFKTLLEMPDERSTAEWVVNWSKLVARSRSRRLAASSARAGGRSGRIQRGDSVQSPLPTPQPGGVR